MNRYFAFGFDIQSEFPLDHVAPSKGTMEGGLPLSITSGSWSISESDRLATIAQTFCPTKKGMLFSPVEKGDKDILVPNPASIVIDTKQGTLSQTMQQRLFSGVMACLCYLNSRIVFHGSVVSLDDEALALVGRRGRGKSTTAAAFVKRGWRLISDDLCVVENGMEGKGVTVFPGQPIHKLKRSSFDALYPDSDWNEEMEVMGSMKQLLTVEDQCELNPVELKAVYLIRDATEKVPRLQEIQHLLKYRNLRGYSFRGGLIRDLGLEAEQFKLLSNFGNQVPVVKAWRTDHLEDLSKWVDLIESSFKRANAG